MKIRKLFPARKTLTTCLLIASTAGISGFAQQKILGKITAQGNSLSGVVIKVKGGNKATQTDKNGQFEIDAPPGATLYITYIGYSPQEIAIKDQGFISADLIAQDQALEEVTVIGYGSQRSKDLTGSVATLKAESFKDQPVLDAASALQGRVSGVAVSQSSGAPGGKAKIRIRGNNSISGSNEPLYIVDGIALNSFSLQDINVNDIESMDVLKDASATAVYGSRGANGVVLISTKKGKVGATTVNYNGFINFNSSPKKYDLMDAESYAKMANMIAGTTVIADPQSYAGKGTDWQSALFKPSQSQNHQLSVTGGTEKAKFFISAFHIQQNGTLVNTNQKKYGFRSNTDIQINNKLSVGVNVFGQRAENHNNAVLTSKDNPIIASVAWAPTESIYEDALNYNRTGVSPIWTNPFLTAKETDNNIFNNMAAINGNIKYQIIPGLTFTSNLGLDLNTGKSASVSNQWLTPGNMKSSQAYSENYAFQNSNVLTYSKTFAEKHALTLTAVEESTINTSSNFNATGSALSTITNGYHNLGLNMAQSIGSGYAQWSLLSFMGRAVYSYDSKYLATVTMRRDGSSKFQDANKWSNFPSVSVGWNLAEEDFIKNANIFNSLKLRAGWGVTGNQAIAPYTTLGLLDPVNYSYGGPTSYQGYTIGNPVTKDLKWETTKQTDIGLDVGILGNRLSLTADYYQKNTEDLLLFTQIDKYLGGGQMLKNVGAIRNNGFEIAINAVPVDGNDFKWTTSVNAAFNKNKVVSLGDGEDMLLRPRMGGGLLSADIQAIKVGEALGSFYLIPWEGVYQQDDATLNRKAGDYKYKDVDGNGSIGYEDRVIVGNATPKVQWGFNNNLNYKNFEFNVFVQGAYGNQIYNATYAAASMVSSDVLYPTLAAVQNYWTADNKNAEWASPTSKSKQYLESTQFLQSGAFARLKNISLSYKLPKDLLKFGSANITLSAQNLFTITKYKGLDPEATSTSANSDTDSGIDLGAYPTPKSYSIRLNLTF